MDEELDIGVTVDDYGGNTGDEPLLKLRLVLDVWRGLPAKQSREEIICEGVDHQVLQG
jgi:hypothetical protein